MELFDYVKFRWKALTALLIIGVVAIVLLGQRSAGDVYQARSQVLVRPSAAEQGAAASNFDRFINTEMTLLFTPASLQSTAADLDISPERLAAAMSYTKAPDSDFVVLQARSRDLDQSVEMVNAVAQAYLASAEARAVEPLQAQSEYLKTRIDNTRARLTDTSNTIKNNLAAYQLANPDTNSPSSEVLSPDAATEQSILRSRVDRFSSQLADIDLDLQNGASRSAVIAPAAGATQTPGWGPVTYLAAIAGLVLLLLVLAGAGLALSRRVLGQSRWAQATSDGRLRRSVVLRRGSAANRRRSARRVAGSLRASGAVNGRASVVYLPEKTPSLTRRSAGLLKALDDAGISAGDLDSLDETLLDAPGEQTSPLLLLVDTVACRLEDAAQLAEYPESVQHRIVPVLV